jgi:hypothetical protein
VTAAFEYQCGEGMMTARKAMTMAEFYAALVAWLWPKARERVTQVKPDPHQCTM